jgi:hypothetical protein
MSQTQQTPTSDEEQHYTITVTGEDSEYLLRLLDQVTSADNAQDAVWYGREDRRKIETMKERFKAQLREQENGGEF